MNPIKLTMKGFLTFKEETVIDFTDLKSQGLFLVTGPTGSGKSSIFDAISYALYGKTASSDRNKTGSFRSQLLDEEAEYLVRLHFQVGKDEYEVERLERGKTTKKARLVINGREGEAKTKITEVNQAVEEALGLTADQFCQIVMLPQGEFRNFLMASSLDKSAILRRLFNTEHHQRMKDIVQKRLKFLNQEMDRSNLIIQREKQVSQSAQDSLAGEEILEIMTREGEDLASGLKQAKKAVDAYEKAEALAKKNVDEAMLKIQTLERLAILKAKYEDLQSQEEGFQELGQKVRLLREMRPLAISKKYLDGLVEDLARSRASLKENLQKLNGVKANHEACQLKLKEHPDLRKKLVALAHRIQDLDQVMEQLKQKENQKAQLAKLNQEAEELGQKLKVLSRAKADRDRLRQELDDNYDKSKALGQRRQKLQQEKETVKAYLDLKESWQRKSEEMDKNQSQLDYLAEQNRLQEKRHEELKGQLDRWLEEKRRAGLGEYKDLLKDGEPCPLCGSVHHPNPINARGIPSEDVNRLSEEVHNLKAEMDKRQGETNYLKSRLAELKQELSQLPPLNESLTYRSLDRVDQDLRSSEKADQDLEREQQSLRQALYDCQTLLETGQALEDNWEENKTNRQRLETLLDASGDIDEDEDSLKKQQAIARQDHDRLEEKLNYEMDRAQAYRDEFLNLRASIQGDKEHLEALKAKVAQGEASFSEGLAAMGLSLEGWQELLPELPQLNKREGEVKAFEDQFKEAKTRYEAALEDAPEPPEEDMGSLEAKLTAARAKRKEAQDQVQDLVRSETSFQSALDRIREAVEVQRRHSQEQAIAQTMFNTTAYGTTFENYVLSYYLEGVLVHANRRLSAMTAHRYSLVRASQEKAGKRSIEGLDLNVFDAYANRQRDVKTLSGGESFKASLAMALGLSDFIQETKAGLRLDTIFIDEGFGTLDQASLDTAMETIMEIQGLGRLVGIISHVEELKERIPCQIQVENRGAKGSFVKIKLP